jgi:hypothetical protein
MLRWWIFRANKNGLKRALFRVNNRVFIDQEAFDLWLESHRLASNDP